MTPFKNTKIGKALKNPLHIVSAYMTHHADWFPDDEKYIKCKYFCMIHRCPDLKNPKTFNEKLNWLKLHDRNPLYTKLADKYEVKQFVADAIGSEYVVTCYGTWDSFEDIDWDKLPDKFVLKTTHASMGAIICSDKNTFDKVAAEKIITNSLNNHYFLADREWPYKDIKPRVIADQLLEGGAHGVGNAGILSDYKFWCFNGEPKVMYMTVKSSQVFENFYDMDFKPVSINHGFPRNVPEFCKPKNFEKMVELAGKLAKISQTVHVRVDFFNVDGKIYFGEFTLYDWSGFRPFKPERLDEEIGSWIILPDTKTE